MQQRRHDQRRLAPCRCRRLTCSAATAAAGTALCDLLHGSNSEALVGGVCAEILESDGAAEWAQRRLGLHHLWRREPAAAVAALQVSLRHLQGARRR